MLSLCNSSRQTQFCVLRQRKKDKIKSQSGSRSQIKMLNLLVNAQEKAGIPSPEGGYVQWEATHETTVWWREPFIGKGSSSWASEWSKDTSHWKKDWWTTEINDTGGSRFIQMWIIRIPTPLRLSKSHINSSPISAMLICLLDPKFSKFERFLLGTSFSNWAGGTGPLNWIHLPDPDVNLEQCFADRLIQTC